MHDSIGSTSITLLVSCLSVEGKHIICPALHVYRICKLNKDLAQATQKNGLWNILPNDLECHMLVAVLCSVLQDTLQSKPLLLPTCSLKCFVVLKTCDHHSSQFKSSSTRGKVWSLVILVPHAQRRNLIKSVMSEKWTFFVYSKLYHHWTDELVCLLHAPVSFRLNC